MLFLVVDKRYDIREGKGGEKMRFLHSKYQLSPFQIILLGFGAVILIGSFILMLPISTNGTENASFIDALFTSTSAVCVTGLIVHDTATYWSTFGQVVIISLIQIGGMGVVTIVVSLAMISGRKISLLQRNTMKEAISAPQTGGIVRLTGFIMRAILMFELIGVIAMAPVFCKRFGLGKGIWYAVFHSISAFCNAGFDIMGIEKKYSSLTAFIDDPVINITIMALIVIGGIGFLTWDDIKTHKFSFSKYRMQSKVILTVTTLLILLPAIYFFFGEFAYYPLKERILSSFFQSVTPRTAGFNTVDLNTMTETGQMILIILMLIGGSPGSTAGGMKTTTLAVLFASAAAVFRKHDNAHFYKRRISEDVIRNACAILCLYVVLFLGGGLIISRIENLPLLTCLFETGSAVGTVGLSLGATPGLGSVSKMILILLMYFGRVGGLTVMFATMSINKRNIESKFPQEKITVG